MRTARDLRDLVNVSRLTYRESDDETAENLSDAEEQINTKQTKSYSNLNASKNKLSEQNILSYERFKLFAPTQSVNTPIEAIKKKQPNTLNNPNKSNSSFNKSILLLDRNSIPDFTYSKRKLPPLSIDERKWDLKLDLDQTNDDENQLCEEKAKNESTKLELDQQEENESETNRIKPLDDQLLTPKANVPIENGNFDEILTYIDASNVSDWLNRSNRLLKKLFKWHQDGSMLHQNRENKKSSLKYESFILFANFWLGSNEQIKFTDKQRRQLLQMEYSIIVDEVTQAFQVGIDSQKVSMSDVNRLMRAVFKEYPLQLLSFRGTYMILNFIDTLGSDRHDEYKTLLSDVKCRTSNKQCAQWLLSIRSFALINLCWSVIKFYMKNFEQQVEYKETARIMSARRAKESEKEELKAVNKGLIELDGRLSSLKVEDREYSSMSTSSSSSSLSSSNSSPKSSASNRNKTASKLSLNHSKAQADVEPLVISKFVKHEKYLDAIFKHDFPECLHYMLVTNKCDALQRDEHGRTLIFLAVMNEKPKILSYLIKRWPSIDINEPCDSGNTPLHTAVNKGNLKLVEIILQALDNDEISQEETNQKQFKLNVNKTNPKCMNATPLHLAVWNDFNEIALRLIQANADPYLKMNDISNAFDLASENSNDVLLELLNDFMKFKQ